jgi:adenosylcobinamide-GDP ribazoletransferase
VKEELKILGTAILYYTRLPWPFHFEYAEQYLTKSVRYLPFVGIVTGSFCALILYLSQLLLPIMPAIALSMVASVLLTGAMHEDGFADFCDGFGGGSTKEKILAIMKDSANGTFAVVGIVLMLGTKFLLLSSFPVRGLLFILVIAHTLSRLMPVFFIYTAKYARPDGPSKARPVGADQSLLSLIIAILIGFLPLLFLTPVAILIVMSMLSLLFLVFRHYVVRKLGGYTGDILGALQQISELSIYMVLLAISKYYDVLSCFCS